MGFINGGSLPEKLPVEFSNSSSHSSGKMLPQCRCRLVTNSQLSSCFLGYCITLMIFRCTEVPEA
ncbi:hypothetical protein NC652_002201 [Populus alba x Populus x berolinensis]|nr:hypothetical protein NC652_002201 [Populus alba x Populus x berolinensis]